MELWAASLSNPELRAVVLPRILAWRRVVRAAVRDAVADYDLDLPVSPEAIADWVCTYWGGMEFENLIGMGEEDGHYREGLDFVQRLLEQLDRRAAARHAPTEAEPATQVAAREPAVAP